MSSRKNRFTGWRHGAVAAAAAVLLCCTTCPAQPTPAAADELWSQAAGLLREYRDADAEPALRKLLQVEPQHAEGQRALGLLLCRWYRYEEADAHLTRYLGSGVSADGAALLARAKARYSLLDWAGAEGDLEALQQLEPASVDEASVIEAERLLRVLTEATPEDVLTVEDELGRRLGMIRYECSSRRAAWYAEALQVVLPQVEEFAGRRLPPVGLVLLADQEAADRWHQAFAGREAPGCAFYNYRVLVLNVHASLYGRSTRAKEEATRATILRHELAHHMVDEVSGAHATPRWLNEGIAERVSRLYAPHDSKADLADYMDHGRLPLALEEFFLASDATETDHAFYAQAAGFADYLTEITGGDVGWVGRYLDARRGGKSTDEAIRQAVGRSKEAAFATWEESLKE